VVRISPTEGEFGWRLEARELEIILRRAGDPKEVRVNGEVVRGWWYQAEGRRVVVEGVRWEERKETVVELQTRA